jgi:hypothetical protein
MLAALKLALDTLRVLVGLPTRWRLMIHSTEQHLQVIRLPPE